MKFGALIMTAALAGASTLFALGSQASAEPVARTDCRTYSSVTTCGTVELTAVQKKCVAESTALGMTERRATAECHSFAG